jgi:hypothetical protein
MRQIPRSIKRPLCDYHAARHVRMGLPPVLASATLSMNLWEAIVYSNDYGSSMAPSIRSRPISYFSHHHARSRSKEHARGRTMGGIRLCSKSQRTEMPESRPPYGAVCKINWFRFVTGEGMQYLSSRGSQHQRPTLTRLSRRAYAVRGRRPVSGAHVRAIGALRILGDSF